MNTAIAHLTQQRVTLLENAAVAHKEGRTDDRDKLLNDANDLSAAIRQLHGIVEPELPGLGLTEKEYWADLLKQAGTNIRVVPVIQGPDCGATAQVKSMLGIEEMPTERKPDHDLVGWFNPKTKVFQTDVAISPTAFKNCGYQKATAHIYLDKP